MENYGLSPGRFRVLDLFSGIGGMSLGLERAGMETAAFCEIEPFCQEVLKQHWPHVPVFSDVRDLTKEKLHEKEINLICGGFPCQDISAVGPGEGLKGKRSGLWSEFLRLIEEFRPDYALVENVTMLRSRGLVTVLQNLREVGYDAEWHCIPASALGAPHRRDRLWILAYPTRQRSARRAEIRGGARLLGTGNVPELGGGREIAAGGFMAGQGGSQTVIQAYVRAAIEKNIFAAHWQAERQPKPLVNGISKRLDLFAWKHSLKAYGNAVIPQIPEMLGRGIIRREQLIAFFQERMQADITEIYV